MPDPQDPATFERSKPRWADLESPADRPLPAGAKVALPPDSVAVLALE